INRFNVAEQVGVLRLDNLPALFGQRLVLIGADLQEVVAAIRQIGGDLLREGGLHDGWRGSAGLRGDGCFGGGRCGGLACDCPFARGGRLLGGACNRGRGGTRRGGCRSVSRRRRLGLLLYDFRMGDDHFVGGFRRRFLGRLVPGALLLGGGGRTVCLGGD